MVKESRKGIFNPFKAMAGKIKDGDRVIWIVFTLLVLISLVAIFSSTSTMAIKQHVSRMDIFVSQLWTVLAGLVLVLVINIIPSVKLFREFSRLGFLLSLFLLLMLVCKVKIGNFIHVEEQHEAIRSIKIAGVSLAVYEVVKVAMVMYLSWAVHQYEGGHFPFTEWLSGRWPKYLGWLRSPVAMRWVYIFGPMLLVSALILVGSSGSAVLCFSVMMVTVIVAGMKWKHIFQALGVALGCAALAVGLHIVTSSAFIPRMRTVFTRLNVELPYPDPEVRESQRKAIAKKSAPLEELEPGTEEFKEWADAVRQPRTAKLAVVQGGRLIVGKGPGQSTQKYVCPIMFEDYMFSFIVEEYGLVGAALILILYLSLFARGMILVHNSDYRFAKGCIGGLVFLITGQAMFHILVNCDIGLVTGQTLPLISHGRCSFLCFCIAFGVILSISVKVNKKVKMQQAQEAKILEMDDIRAGVSMVEDMEEELWDSENGDINDNRRI